MLESQPSKIVSKRTFMNFLISSVSFRVNPEFAKCDVIDIPFKGNKNPNAFGFQKNSPYVEIFDYYLRELLEEGIVDKIKEKYRTLPPDCGNSAGKPLGFTNCFTAFLPLVLGTIIALIIALFENLFKINGRDEKVSEVGA